MVWTRHVLSALVLLASLSTRAGADTAAPTAGTAVADTSANDAMSVGNASQDSDASTGQASPAASGSSQRMNAVFKSLQDNTRGKSVDLPMKPIGIVVVSLIGITVALKQWNRRQQNPKPLSNHRKLIKEAAKASGISPRKLKRIAPLAHAEGLSSPLVAIICPSAIKRLASNVRTADDQAALKSVAESLFRAEGRGRTVD